MWKVSGISIETAPGRRSFLCRWSLKFVKSREIPLYHPYSEPSGNEESPGIDFTWNKFSEKSDFLAEKWISWKWIETPGDKRLDERRRADFRWTLMFGLIWWSGWWWREMQQVGPPQLYVLKNAATPKLNIWDLCSSFFVTNNPLQEQCCTHNVF